MFGNRKSSTNDEQQDFEETSIPSVVKDMLEVNRQAYSMSQEAKEESAVQKPSVLSAGAIFVGKLTSPGPVHAQGQLQGELSAPLVTLEHTGQMSGKLNCDKLVIDGKFDGELSCDEAVAGDASVLDGVLICKSLKAAPGAQITGSVQIGRRDQ